MGSETMSSSTHDSDPTYKAHSSSSALSPAMHQRARRKSAKAAAAFVTAAIKEEMLVPPPSPSATKRSYSRGNSQGSSASATAPSASHINGNGTSTGGSSSSSHAASATAATKRSHVAQSKKKTALSSFAVEYLKNWMMSPDHIEHPYPTEDEKAKIMKETGIELKQLTNWFVNNRKRYWKPKVEELRRQSSISNVTLQEIAAAAQVASPGSLAGGAVSEARKHSVDESLKTVSVLSEDEESAQSSTHQQPRKQPSPSSNNKKRKKSFSADKTTSSNNNGNQSSRSFKKVKDGKKIRHHHQPVANPIPSLAALPLTNNPPSGPAPGIHVAATYASVKAARKMTQNTISETSSTDDSGDDNEEVHRLRGSRGEGNNKRFALESPSSAMSMAVSNPLAGAVALMPTASGMSSMFSDDVVVGPSTSAVDGFTVTSSLAAGQNQALTPPSFAQQQYPPGVLDAGLVADLDYSISPMDNQVVANTGAAASAAAAAAAAGFCCNIMPHSCNLADPMAVNSLNRPPPCALCSACRDWNLGEFCPWDLTGILGDICADGTIPEPAPYASYSSASSSEGTATLDLEEEDFTAPVATLPPVASSPYDRLDQDGTIEEATTVTKNSMLEVADVASVDGNGNSDANTVVNYSSSDTTEGGSMISSPLFTIPHEISHSTSAADFIASMVDIESW